MKFFGGTETVTSNIRTLALATTVGVLAFSASAQAQSLAQADLETERALERQRLLQQQTTGIGGIDGFGPLLREVTFQEVLADPDNIELNVLYARTQIKLGRLDKAQAALERILLMQPDLTIVKMLYGLVLFRLDNTGEAETVFNELLQSDIAQADRDVIEAYLGEIAKRKKRLNVTLTVSAGLHYDSNRTSIPRSGNLSLLDTELVLGLNETRDWGTVVSVGGEARYDLGFQRPHEGYAKLTLIADEQRYEPAYNLIMGRADVGVSLAYDIGKVDASANYSVINLGGASYMTSPGGQLRWDANPGSAYVPYAQVSATHQLYSSRNGDNTNNERNGFQFGGTIGASTNTWIDGGLSDLSVTRTIKNAKMDYEAYRTLGAALSHTQVFEQGRFVIANAAVTATNYLEADTFVSSTKRRDMNYVLGLTGGMALGSSPLIGDLVPDPAKDIVLTATVERAITNSNIVNYSYDNWRGQMMVTKSFGF